MAQAGSGYDAFISYSHALDGTLAVALQTGLERFAKPWYRSRALRVFRDNTNLVANADLWSSIEAALTSSNWFVLMASPTAARSLWVAKEVTWWREHRPSDHLLVVLTEGEFAWAADTDIADDTKIDTSAAALPLALRGAFTGEPRWVDLRWLRDATQVDQSNPRLRECVADVAAAVRGVPKDELVGEHIRQHRRTMGLARGGVTALALLLVAATVAAVLAVVRGNQVVAEQHTAIARGMVAQADQIRDRDPRGALRFGVAADTIDPSPLTSASLTESLLDSPYRATLPAHAAVDAVAVFPDGRTLAAAADDGSVQLWDLADRARPRPIGAPLPAHRGRVNAMVLSADGQVMATAGNDSTVRIWDLTDRTRPHSLILTLTSHRAVVTLALSPDGRTLATAAQDRTVVLWDLTDRAATRRGLPLVMDYGGRVAGLKFSPDGRTLTVAVAATGVTVVVWDLSDRTRPRLLGRSAAGSTSVVATVAFSPDGHTMAVGDVFGPVSLWDVSDPAGARPIGAPLTGQIGAMDLQVSALAFSPDGHTLAAGAAERTLLVWDVTDPGRPGSSGRTLREHTADVTAVAFLTDGHTLASASRDASVVLWDLAGAPPVRPLAGLPGGQGIRMSAVAQSGDGHLVATTSDDTVLLWDLADRSRPRRLGQALTDAGNGIAMSADGRTFVTANHDRKTVVLWDLSDPAHPRGLGMPLPNFGSVVAISPDGTMLATCEHGGKIALWDLTDRTQPRRLSPPLSVHADLVGALAFSHDGSWLASAGAEDNRDPTAILWDLTDRAHPRQVGPPLAGHTGTFVMDLTFSPDGQTLATAGLDSTVLLWDLSDRSRPHRLGQPLAAHDEGVLGVAFSPDGRTLATGDQTKAVVLWDMTDRAQPRRLGTSLAGATDPVVFSPDSRTLLSGSPGGPATRWDLTSLEDLRRNATREACARTGTPLSRESWAFFAPGVEYRDVCAGG